MASAIPDEDEPFCILQLHVDLARRNGEPYGYIMTFKGEILAGDDAEEHVGDIKLYVVDLLTAEDEGEHPAEVLDCLNRDLAAFCPIVSMRTGVYLPSIQDIAGEWIGRLLVISRVELKPEYRGAGVGKAAVGVACERFGGFCSLAILKPYPLQWSGKQRDGDSQFRKDRAKLVRYYESMGFRKVLKGAFLARSLVR